MKTLVLASSSPRRHEILSRARIPFVVDPSDYHEDLSLNLPPHELVKALALGKAHAVREKHSHSVIIGADTIVVLDGEVFGKPHTVEHAKRMLMRMSGNTNTIVTGFAIVDADDGKTVTESQEARVTFRTMTDQEIDGYIATGEPHRSLV